MSEYVRVLMGQSTYRSHVRPMRRSHSLAASSITDPATKARPSRATARSLGGTARNLAMLSSSRSRVASDTYPSLPVEDLEQRFAHFQKVQFIEVPTSRRLSRPGGRWGNTARTPRWH